MRINTIDIVIQETIEKEALIMNLRKITTIPKEQNTTKKEIMKKKTI